MAASPPRGRTLIEAELKARVHDPAALRARLRRLASEEISLYRDTYSDGCKMDQAAVAGGQAGAFPDVPEQDGDRPTTAGIAT